MTRVASEGLSFSIRGHLSAFAVITLGAVVLNLILITNPGYFSHDELQRWDDVEEFGLIRYFQMYISLPATQSLSDPFRPFPFAIQGLLSLAQNDFPPLVHLFGALTTGLVGFVFYLLLVEVGLKYSSALASGLIFLVLPTTVLATGWSAALMDQWYVIFGLAALSQSLKYLRTTQVWAWVLSTLFFSLSLLSKETAVIWPAVLVVVALIVNRRRPVHRFHWIALALAWSLPALAYLFARLEAFVGTFTSPGSSGHYGMSLENIPRNAFAYFVFPFAPGNGWVSSLLLTPPLILAAACVAHLGLAFWIGKRVPKVGWLYLPAYFVFLAPILALNATGAQYLYGSGLALAGALGILVGESAGSSRSAIALWVAIALMAGNSILAQTEIHRAGVCSRVALTSVESAHASLGYPDEINLLVESGDYEHVVRSVFFARERVGPNSRVSITFAPKTSMDDPIPTDPLIEIDAHCRAKIIKR